MMTGSSNSNTFFFFFSLFFFFLFSVSFDQFLVNFGQFRGFSLISKFQFIFEISVYFQNFRNSFRSKKEFKPISEILWKFRAASLTVILSFFPFLLFDFFKF